MMLRSGQYNGSYHESTYEYPGDTSFQKIIITEDC